MKYAVLYNDRSGMFGDWEYSDGEWRFIKRIDVAMTEDDMEYALKELRIIKEKIGNKPKKMNRRDK